MKKNFRQRLNVLASLLRKWSWDDKETQLALARRAANLGFKEFARLLRAYHHAQEAEDASDDKVHWYHILSEFLSDEPDENAAYGSLVPTLTKADLPKWKQAAWAICPDGTADFESSGAPGDVLKGELDYAAKIKDPKIRAMRKAHVKIVAAAQEAYDELSEYVTGADAQLFVCPCCDSEITPEEPR